MTAALAIGAAIGLVAAVEDLRRRQVPNWLTAGGAAAGLAYATRGGWHGFALAAAGVIVGFLILLPFQCCGAMGGGDVKLMAAFGALLGPAGILLAALFASIAGGVWAVGALLYRPRMASIPYAPAVVLGAWISLLGGGS
jgi:prepilin peptidase CpaA